METRESILNIAFKLFMERGFTDVSINDILKELNMTKGALYYHFKSKEEIFRETAGIYLIEPMKYFAVSIKSVQGNIFDFLNNLFYSYLYMVDELIKMMGDQDKVYGYYLYIFSAKRVSPEISRELSEIYSEIETSLAVKLEEAIKNNLIRKDIVPSDYSHEIISLCEGIFTIWILNKSRDYKEAYKLACENVIKFISMN